MAAADRERQDGVGEVVPVDDQLAAAHPAGKGEQREGGDGWRRLHEHHVRPRREREQHAQQREALPRELQRRPQREGHGARPRACAEGAAQQVQLHLARLPPQGRVRRGARQAHRVHVRRALRQRQRVELHARAAAQVAEHHHRRAQLFSPSTTPPSPCRC
eukprot:scaffold1978_cov381-Prasinococcus_capsulatus_cf.AAC.15